MALTKVTYSMISGAPVNIVDYGADATGASDSTSAIQAAIDSGKNVYIPTGTFIVTGLTVPSNTYMYGGGYSSCIKLKDGANYSILNPVDESLQYNNIVIDNIRFDGNAANQTLANRHVMRFRAFSKTVVRNCWIEDAKGDGIIFAANTAGDQCEDICIENCYIARSGRNGVSITAATRFSIINTYSYDAVSGADPGDGFDIENDSGRTVTDGVIIGCHSYGNYGRGFHFQANNTDAVQRITVSGCHAYNNECRELSTYGGFMTASAKSVLFSNCYSYSNFADGFRLIDSSQFIRLTNCNSTDNGGNGFIEIAGGTINNNHFIDCFAASNTTANWPSLVGSNSSIRHSWDGAASQDNHSLYKEGAITPTIGGESSNPSSVTYTTQTGWFTQTGDRVNFNLKVAISAVTGGTGGMCIDLDAAVPASANITNNDAVLTVASDSLTFGASGYLVGLLEPNSRRILLRNVTNGAAINNMAIDSTCTIWVTGSYKCAV